MPHDQDTHEESRDTEHSVGAYIIGRNCQDTLGPALESVYSQSRPVDEVIYLDDGSTDASLEVARRYIERGLVVLRNFIPQGIPAARNRAVSACRSRWIAVLDADDRWHAEKIQRQLGYLQEHPRIGLLGTFARAIDGAGNTLGTITAPVGDEDIKDAELIRNCFVHSSVIFGRALFEQAGGYANLEAAEDYDLMLKLSEQACASNLPDVLTDYRISDHSTSVWKRRILRGCSREARDDAYRRRGLRPNLRTTATAAIHQLFLALVLFDPRIHWGAHQLSCGHPKQGRELLRRAREGGLRNRLTATALLMIPNVFYRFIARLTGTGANPQD